MSATIAAPAGGAGQIANAKAARPSFLGILGGELFKIAHQRIIWVATALLACFVAGPYLIYLAGKGISDEITSTPLEVLYIIAQRDLEVVRVFGGVYVLVLAALVVGQEYQLGTIRILLGRGVGRLQLLGAKVLALTLVALMTLAGALVLDTVLAGVDALILAHNLNVFSALTARFWSDIGQYLVTVLISMGATLLLGVAANVLGRSMAFGLGLSLVWFPADNIGSIVIGLIGQFTNSTFWPNLTGFFLGPVLNLLPALEVPSHLLTIHGERGVQIIVRPASTLGLTPLVNIDNTHALLVIAGYSLVFAAVAIVLMWRRDVLE